ncbi:hypothetical protein DYH09_03590 [bacterium CPR1]|nr:hypothetical protein [bacterium CPR1]
MPLSTRLLGQLLLLLAGLILLALGALAGSLVIGLGLLAGTLSGVWLGLGLGPGARTYRSKSSA